ncbi:hypothetical protein MVES1_002536 [Malassezia vespertilionis]|uniref:Small ribosomal subunit protein uS10m n=1 Tax=Malassezia vespertilionis TaxID=2020962 RepID=A0A2N1JAC6_9BASI|nr:uncharacterized protein MVES1_002536 [Malassezia vespertilionis]PKI83497.1 Rsm10p [Malassezia vespertilionis]WFD07177.1 hypothetical protein MVES1_002536 [Malassezia vespertilionis]
MFRNVLQRDAWASRLYPKFLSPKGVRAYSTPSNATGADLTKPASGAVSLDDFVPPVEAMKPTHGVHVATLQLKSYNAKMFDLDFFADFAVRAANAFKVPSGGIASLPIRTSLWTVPRGPFVHKKSQENFWRRTHRRSIKLYDASDATVDRLLQYLRMHEMPGVASKVSLFRRYPLGIMKQIENTDATKTQSEQSVREMADEILRLYEVENS